MNKRPATETLGTSKRSKTPPKCFIIALHKNGGEQVLLYKIGEKHVGKSNFRDLIANQDLYNGSSLLGDLGDKVWGKTEVGKRLRKDILRVISNPSKVKNPILNYYNREVLGVLNITVIHPDDDEGGIEVPVKDERGNLWYLDRADWGRKMGIIIALHKKDGGCQMFRISNTHMSDKLFNELIADGGMRYNDTCPQNDLPDNYPWMETDVSQKLRRVVAGFLSNPKRRKDTIMFNHSCIIVGALNLQSLN